MSKRTRQYLGLLAAVAAYYVVHEGAHLLYALALGVFKEIRFLGLGMQIDIYREHLTDTQLGVFCLLGATATLLVGYGLVLASKWICGRKSKLLRAVLFYITIIMLILDPVYLGVLCTFFGGGDMNGIALLIPKAAARVIFLFLLALNVLVFWKIVLPQYRKSFQK